MPSNQIVQEFLIESFENLSNISDQLTQYEKEKDNKELLNSIYRKVHTLKGSANFLSFKKLQELTHVSENILDLLREDKIELNAELIDILLKSFDLCLVLLNDIEKNEKEGDHEITDLILELQKFEKKATSSNSQELPFDEAPVNLGVVHAGGGHVEKEAIDEDSTEEINPGLKIVIPEDNEVGAVKEKNEQPDASSEKKTDKQPVKNLADSVVRVNVELLDKIMNVVGELVLNRNQILQYAGNYENGELNRLAQQLNGITTELQTDIMTTRMQPVGSVFSKFERVVRDLARSEGKKIKLSISGKDTELDKTLLDAIRDPLTHLIRNAADHGVESPQERSASGKDEEGHIQIRAYHEGGQVTIEIQDDGKGLDPEKISQKALEKGIVSSEELKKMTTKQLQSLVMRAGFSTAEKVTNISGRGVGMDVVKSNIEKIGGSVDISSEPGKGSTFKLKIPLTLAIVPALVVEAHHETFAIPQINLVELVRIEDEQVESAIEKIHQNEFYRLRGELIPIFRLGEKLKIEKLENDKEDLRQNDGLNIAVLNAEGITYGLIVDQVLDTQEIVVKPLSKNLKKLNVFAGATIMGDGRVSLIVDALGFYGTVTNGHINKAIKKNIKTEQSEVTTNYSESKEMLVVKLADKREYAIPLVLVSRLEELNLSDVEWSGDRALVRYRGQAMPLINLEKVLDIDEQSKIMLKDESLETEQGHKFDCVVVKIANKNFGLVVNDIKDIAVTDSDVNTEITAHQGMLGTVFVSDKTLTVLDIHEILTMTGLNIQSSKTHLNTRARILLVEDSPLYQKIQSEFFKEVGFEVVIEENGRRGLERLQQEDFDLVVTDIEMPEMNGWEFASAVRALQDIKLKTKPIVAVSTRVSDEDKKKGVESGFTKHLEKFDKDEVLEAINFCLAS